MTAIAFKNRKLVLVEYPAVVRNTDRMLMSLGGVDEVSKAYSDPSRRIEVKFRPEDPYCKSAYANRFSTSCLVLKVKKNTKNPEEPCVVSIEGTVTAVYKFRGMMDFQFLPMTKKEGEAGYEPILDKLLPTPVDSTDWLMQGAPVYILPQVFARLDNVSMQQLRDEPKRRDLPEKSAIRPKNVLGGIRHRRVKFACFLSFEDEEVPKEPNPAAWKQLEWRPPDAGIKKRIEQLFEERPMWTRSALQVELKVLPMRFKLILPVVAYYVLNGPYRAAWVRMGFDPRKDPSTKVYQVLDFRLKASPCGMGDNVATKRGTSAYLVPTKVLGLTSRPICAQTDYLQAAACGGKVAGDEELPPPRDYELLCRFLPGRLPPYRQMFYHLEDIRLDSVQALVHANDGREAVCHERDGWLAEGTINRCRQLMVADIRATMDRLQANLPPSMSRPTSPIALEDDIDAD